MNAQHEQIVAHVEITTPRLAEMMRQHGPLHFPAPRPPFEALCRAIIGQQLSTQAAATVWRRFDAQMLHGVLPADTPSHMLSLSISELRTPGLSQSKARAIHSLAEAFTAQPERYCFDSEQDDRSDDEISRDLQRIRGIGPWTAQMFLMFTLQRPDVFAEGDLGIRKGMAKLIGSIDLSPSECLRHAENWRPYRSNICLHLWKAAS